MLLSDAAGALGCFALLFSACSRSVPLVAEGRTLYRRTGARVAMDRPVEETAHWWKG